MADLDELDGKLAAGGEGTLEELLERLPLALLELVEEDEDGALEALPLRPRLGLAIAKPQRSQQQEAAA